MTKHEFLEELERLLKGLPRCDIDSSLEYYDEMIDDKIDEGLSEEESIKAIGTPREIADGILRETPIVKLVKEKVMPKRQLTGLEVVLIVLGFPLWFPLIITAFAVVLSVIISLWAVVISLWTVPVCLGASAVAVFAATVINLIACRFGAVLFLLGAGLFLAGAALLCWPVCLYATKGLIWLCKKTFLLIKRCFVGKGRAK